MTRTAPKLAVLVAALALCTPAEAGTRRFALVAGNDDGGEGTTRLLYAQADARKLHDILTRLGGVRAEDARLMLEGSAEALVLALTELEGRAQAAAARGERTTLFVYYSGHARDGALRLGDTRLPLASLKERLRRSAADVRVAILDACQSGAMTRRKGARRAPEFEVQADATLQARGMVILTSSASDEDSQESDLIGGSYFSHHLASGLLGDADRSRDGAVSLSEAYAYAYERTVADTAASFAGAQHPTYSFDFEGNGDLVLTRVGDRREGLLFPADAPAGVYFVVEARGFVLAEVWKPVGEPRRLAVPPGAYLLKRRLPDRLRVGKLEVVGGRLTHVDEAALRDAPFSDDPVKGARRGGARLQLALVGGYQSFFDASARVGLFPSAGLLGVEGNLRDFFRRDWTWSFDLALGAARSELALDGLRLDYRFSELTVGTSLLAGWPLGPLTPFVGGRMGFLSMMRTFDDPRFYPQSFYTFTPGLVGGVHLHLGRGFDVTLRGRVHYLLYNVDENRSLGYWDLAASIGYLL